MSLSLASGYLFEKILEADDRGVIPFPLVVELADEELPCGQLLRQLLQVRVCVLGVRAGGIAVFQEGEALDRLECVRLVALYGGRLLLVAFREAPQGVSCVLVLRVAVDEILVSYAAAEAYAFFAKLESACFICATSAMGSKG